MVKQDFKNAKFQKAIVRDAFGILEETKIEYREDEPFERLIKDVYRIILEKTIDYHDQTIADIKKRIENQKSKGEKNIHDSFYSEQIQALEDNKKIYQNIIDNIFNDRLTVSEVFMNSMLEYNKIEITIEKDCVIFTFNKSSLS